jgi:hypothetical protein
MRSQSRSTETSDLDWECITPHKERIPVHTMSLLAKQMKRGSQLLLSHILASNTC